MKKPNLILTVLALAMLGLTAGGCASAAAADSVPGSVYVVGQNTGISVSGIGKIAVTADVAVLSMGVQAQGLNAVEAQQKAAQSMAKVMAALKNNGVADKDIVTTGYSVYPVYNYDKDWVGTIVGYTASNYITAKVRNVDNAGKTVDAVVVVGGDEIRINNISFAVDNPDQYNGAARELAMADALARAKQLASLSGVQLGKPAYITESGGYNYYQPMVYYEYANTDPAKGSTSISPNEIDITIVVQVVYNIQ